MNARFLLDEHGDVYYYYAITVVYIVSSSIKKNKENLSGGKNDIAGSVHKTSTLAWKL